MRRRESAASRSCPSAVGCYRTWCHADNGDLDAARNDLRLAHRARPKRDREGRAIDLINLGAIEIRADRYDAAVGYLDRAATLAQETGVPALQAYARELTGVALHRQNHHGAAEDAWSDAEMLYRSIGDEEGRVSR